MFVQCFRATLKPLKKARHSKALIKRNLPMFNAFGISEPGGISKMVFQPDKKNKYSMRVAVQKIFCVVIAAALAISLTACQKNSDGAESAVSAASASTTGTTYTGTVTEIREESITISTEDGATVTAAMTSDTVIARGMGAGGTQPPEGTPPQQPGQAGEGESMAQSGETPPEMPEGQAPDGMGEGMPQDELTADSVTVGASVTIEVDENNTAISVTLSGGMGAGPGGPGGGASEPESYSAVNEYTEDTSVSDATLTSEGTDENAVLVQTAGITASLDNVNIVRNSEDSTGGDSSSFYGVGAAALVTDGTLNISNSTIESDAAGGAGVFAYGSGTAYVSDTTITAMQNTAGGIHVAGGGTLYAWDLNVEINGESSAAIRSDRGSGTMVVDAVLILQTGLVRPPCIVQRILPCMMRI